MRARRAGRMASGISSDRRARLAGRPPAARPLARALRQRRPRPGARSANRLTFILITLARSSTVCRRESVANLLRVRCESVGNPSRITLGQNPQGQNPPEPVRLGARSPARSPAGCQSPRFVVPPRLTIPAAIAIASIFKIRVSSVGNPLSEARRSPTPRTARLEPSRQCPTPAGCPKARGFGEWPRSPRAFAALALAARSSPPCPP